MRCLQVNKFWYRRAGADIYAMDLAENLTRSGVEVDVLATQHPRNVPHRNSGWWPRYHELSGGGSALTPTAKIAAAAEVIWNRKAAASARAIVRERRPDVAHAHNFLRHLSPAPFVVFRKEGVPLVATLHDHWPTCPTYSLVHGDGTRCEWECSRASFTRCFRHRCVANSGMGSALATVESAAHALFRWDLSLFDLVISPSAFLAASVANERFPKVRMAVVRHPMPRFDWRSPAGGNTTVLYLGRLAREKGVHHLIAAARGAGWLLEIAGTGPYERELIGMAGGLPNVKFLGFQDADGVRSAIERAAIVAVPSVWYENAPLVILEALASGRLVVASDIGGISEYATGGPWAKLVPPANVEALRQGIDSLAEDQPAIEGLCRAAWEYSRSQPGWGEHSDQIRTYYGSLVGGAK